MLKDYKDNNHQCIVNNHSEFVRLLKWFLQHGAENCSGHDIPMFEDIYYLLDDLKVKDECDDEEDDSIFDISKLEQFLLDNINETTLVPSEDEYPILVNWYKEEDFFRGSPSGIKILNFTSLNGIKTMKNYLIDYTQNVRKEKNKWKKFKSKSQ